MSEFPVRTIAILGGGVTAWLAAAVLARVLGQSCAVRVVEHETPDASCGAVATVPSLHRLLRLLGLDEVELMAATDATYRLGTEFRDWGAHGERYFQGFGAVGVPIDGVPFQHYWLRAHGTGGCPPLEEFSTAAQAAGEGRFALPQSDPRSALSRFSYAWHFDTAALASRLRALALRLGAAAIAGRFVAAEIAPEDGTIRALRLEDGTRVAADLYVDTANALAAQLVEDEDWSAWLPCDRMYVARFADIPSCPPYSTAHAQAFGWQFEMPLQHGSFRGLVAASEFVNDDEAIAALLSGSSPAASDSVQVVRLARARPREFWVRNCVFLPGATIDPLEGTALHLAQTGITRLLAHFPVRLSSPPDRAEYNRLTIEEFDRLRDLLAVHYHATRREDSPFWKRQRAASPPDTLAQRLALFADSGRLTIGEEEHCGTDGWLAVLWGQGIRPQSYDPLVSTAPLDRLRAALATITADIRSGVTTMPTHRDFLSRRGRAAASAPT